jgi:integrase
MGGCLTYWNWRARYFRPALVRLGLPVVTPHSARHGFISALQANGVEVGLVAKLAGHANAGVTLSHYTQAVRKGDAAISSLEASYLNGSAP